MRSFLRPQPLIRVMAIVAVALVSACAGGASVPISPTPTPPSAELDTATEELLTSQEDPTASREPGSEEGQVKSEQDQETSPDDGPSQDEQQEFISEKFSAIGETSRFPSLDNPQFIPASEASLDENDLVLGLSLGGESKAYPIRMMWFHHVANDTIG